jgi:pectin methylesterase-like acyl-CoA thioesterase
MRIKPTTIVLALALLALVPPVSGIAAQQPRLHVKPGQSIQAAIDAATPGTVIEVAPGQYQENFRRMAPSSRWCTMSV